MVPEMLSHQWKNRNREQDANERDHPPQRQFSSLYAMVSMMWFICMTTVNFFMVLVLCIVGVSRMGMGIGIICSNGPCWSPDDKIFYFADTFKQDFWAYDYDIETGTVANRRSGIGGNSYNF